MVRNKLIFVGFSYCFLAIVVMPLANLLLQKYPEFPPLGGFIALCEFLVIFYAISLKPKELVPLSAVEPSMSEITQSYFTFLNRLQQIIPGRELGQSSFKFQDYLEGMGLTDMVEYRSGEIAFKPEGLTQESIAQTADSIIRLIKTHSWWPEAYNELINIIDVTFQTLSNYDENTAKDWAESLVRTHGGFLSRNGMLENLSKRHSLPESFLKYESAKAYILEEETPKGAYAILADLRDCNVQILSLTKLSPEAIRKRYGVSNASFITMTYDKSESDLNPDEPGGLLKRVESFSHRLSGSNKTSERSQSCQIGPD
ncbi:hypothetical protein ACFL9T_23000 [Thermodesulfobacteriota bacterium]